jgi:hypothetical protein
MTQTKSKGFLIFQSYTFIEHYFRLKKGLPLNNQKAKKQLLYLMETSHIRSSFREVS